MQDIRWGVIGCGAVCERKSGPAYSMARNSVFNAIWSRNESRVHDYAHRHAIPLVFSSAENLVRSADVDAVYVATPPSTHLGFGQMVAKAGKPCCVEKPMAHTYRDAQKLADCFAQHKQPLFVSYYRRSLDRFAQVKAWLAADTIGAVRHVTWTLTRTPTPDDRAGRRHWRVDPAEAPRGYFDDVGCHGLDLFDHFFGPVDAFQGYASHQAALYEAPDAFTASWMHRTGVLGSGLWNFCSDQRRDDVIIMGDKGQIKFSVFDEQPLVIDSPDVSGSFEIPNPDPIQLPHVQAMIDHLHGLRRHPSTGESALRTSWVMEQMTGLHEPSSPTPPISPT